MSPCIQSSMPQRSPAFGTRLKTLREERSMSLREVAGKSQLDAGYLSRIEAGKVSPPSVGKLRLIAKTLGCDERELLVLAGRLPPTLSRHASLLQALCGLTEEQLAVVEKVVTMLRERQIGSLVTLTTQLKEAKNAK
jgi:HTH-type transcriptional regulator, competence development regulator